MPSFAHHSHPLDELTLAAHSDARAQHASDYLQLNATLSAADQHLQQRVKQFAVQHIQPIINQHWDAATFPHELIPHLQKLNLCGLDIDSRYGGPGLSARQCTLIAVELAKVSAGLATFYSILQPISMLSIYKCGSEQQKLKYLPRMAKLELIGCYGLTEPYAGSDASHLQLQATPTTKDGVKGWLLTGQKRWIGNAPFADIIIAWAVNTQTQQLHGFIVERKAHSEQELHVDTMQHKVALREVQNGDIHFNNCFVSDEQRLTKTNSFGSGPVLTLQLTRLMAASIAVGCLAGAYERCFAYCMQRQQFGNVLASFQLTQHRLVEVCADLQSCQLMIQRTAELYDSKHFTLGQIGMTKFYCTTTARRCLATLRSLQGGNGIVTDFGVGRAFADIEGVHSFEGTAEVNALIAGRELTGISAFAPSVKVKQQTEKHTAGAQKSKL